MKTYSLLCRFFSLPFLLVLAVACGGSPWTTESAEARAALERCLDAEMKLYFRDVPIHCQKALALDPDLTVAKVLLARHSADPERRERLRAELEQADLTRLSPRERFMVERSLAEGPERRRELLDAYLSEHPDDPYALEIRCNELWERQDLERSEACFLELLETDPNWVRAQNYLGYIAMGQGRFAEAEERFKTYRFIAPDQANPHDSMGELLTLIGRYDDAERELEQALAVREDFCPAYQHLIQVHLLQGEVDEARGVLSRQLEQESCARAAELDECQVEVWIASLSGDPDAVWRVAEPCLEQLRPDGPQVILTHLAALRTGRPEAAQELEEQVEEALRKPGLREAGREVLSMHLDHMRGRRALAEGHAGQAVELFRQADSKIRYWSDNGVGVFKLINRLALAGALAEAGRRHESDEVLAEVRAVNPRIANDLARGRSQTR